MTLSEALTFFNVPVVLHTELQEMIKCDIFSSSHVFQCPCSTTQEMIKCESLAFFNVTIRSTTGDEKVGNTHVFECLYSITRSCRGDDTYETLTFSNVRRSTRGDEKV